VVHEAVLEATEQHCTKFTDSLLRKYRKRIEQLSYQDELVEDLFVKYRTVVEHKVPGQHSPDNTVP
jgi:uncharacterized protein